MSPTFAILNNLNASSIFVLGLIGLLLFGKDLPLIARKVATEYFRYKKMINEATADIQREMESAANHLENEKRSLQASLSTTVPSLDSMVNQSATDTYDSADNGSTYADSHVPEPSTHHPVSAPSKPAADPLALDVPSPSSMANRGTDPVKSPAAQVAKLDTYLKSVPPPSKIPPSL